MMKTNHGNRAAAIFQFATSSVHLATALNLIHQESKERERNYFFFWTNRTRFPNRMGQRFSLNSVSDTLLFYKFRKLDRGIIFSNEFDRLLVNSEDTSLLNRISSSCNELQELLVLNDFCPGLGSALMNELSSGHDNFYLGSTKSNKLLVKLIFSYLNVYSNVISLVQKNNIDLVYLYNGRFIHERAVWEACRKLKIKVLLFESTQDRYHISEFGFHNRIENQKRILRNWESSTLDISEKEEIASNYFSKFETPDNPFFQVRDSVSFPFDTPFIAYFSNSDKEAKGFWETWIEPFGSQLNAISALAIACASMNIQLVIRIHPNVAENEGGDLAEWISIARKYNAQIFLNRKEVSTYELLSKCAAVVTYGSTVGIEAAWRGIPTAVLADCKYDELGGILKLSSQEDIYHWLNNLKSDSTIEKVAIRKSAATKWAFFVETGGEKIPQSLVVYGKWGDVEILKFASVCLRINRFQRILHRLFFQLKNLHFRFRPLTKDEDCFGKFLFTT